MSEMDIAYLINALFHLRRSSLLPPEAFGAHTFHECTVCQRRCARFEQIWSHSTSCKAKRSDSDSTWNASHMQRHNLPFSRYTLLSRDLQRTPATQRVSAALVMLWDTVSPDDMMAADAPIQTVTSQKLRTDARARTPR